MEPTELAAVLSDPVGRSTGVPSYAATRPSGANAQVHVRALIDRPIYTALASAAELKIRPQAFFGQLLDVEKARQQLWRIACV